MGQISIGDLGQNYSGGYKMRAAVSLARLRLDQDRHAEAAASRAQWFTAGFETADLKEAEALLDELG